MFLHQYFLVAFGILLFCKLTGQITWGWWWVFSPAWLELLVVFFFGAIHGHDDEEDYYDG